MGRIKAITQRRTIGKKTSRTPHFLVPEGTTAMAPKGSAQVEAIQSIRVKVAVFGSFTRDVYLDAGSKVLDALVKSSVPEGEYSIYLNGKLAGPDEVLSDKDIIVVMPRIRIKGG